MKELVLVLGNADRACLGPLRTAPQWAAADHGGQIWLRGIDPSLQASPAILQIPATARYLLGDDQLLFLPGAATPVAYLPRLVWQPLSSYIRPEMPIAAYGGLLEEILPVALVVAQEPQKIVALRADLEALQAWAEGAAAIRLQALRFAMDHEGSVLVIGEPLPTIPGKAFWECAGLLLPAGQALAYGILAGTIRKQLDPEGDHWLLIEAPGHWERIPKRHFVRATRSGIRQTTIPRIS